MLISEVFLPVRESLVAELSETHTIIFEKDTVNKEYFKSLSNNE